MTQTKTIILDNLKLYFTYSPSSPSSSPPQIKSIGNDFENIVELVEFSGTIKISTIGKSKDKEDSAGTPSSEPNTFNFNPSRMKVDMNKSLMASSLGSLKRPKELQPMKTPLVSSMNVENMKIYTCFTYLRLTICSFQHIACASKYPRIDGIETIFNANPKLVFTPDEEGRLVGNMNIYQRVYSLQFTSFY